LSSAGLLNDCTISNRASNRRFIDVSVKSLDPG
jgi:hypothetical protein